MRNTAKRTVHLSIFTTLWVLSLQPLFGDVLVTKDGKRIETQGKWEVKGRMVQFHSTNGTLQSMRLSEIDLEASEEASKPAPPPAEVEPKEAHPEKPPSLPVRAKSKIDKPTLMIDHEAITGGKRPGLGELILTKNRKSRESRGWTAQLEKAYQDVQKILEEYPELDRYPKRPDDLVRMEPIIKEMSERVEELLPTEEEGNEDLIRFVVGVMLDFSNLVNNTNREGWAERSLDDVDRMWEEIRPR